MSTETRNQLLRAIVDNPDDIGVRLVFADWLEEQGRHLTWAKFIRLQIAEQDKLEPSDWFWTDEVITAVGKVPHTFTKCLKLPCKEPYVIVRRGFVEVVTCSLTDWVHYGPYLVRLHPVCEVNITDKANYSDEPFGFPSLGSEAMIEWAKGVSNELGN